MSRFRFQRLLEHQRTIEDGIRGELVELNARRQHIVDAITALDARRAAGLSNASPAFRQQLMAFTAVCDDHERALRREMDAVDQAIAATRERLIEVWRKRRSLETLAERQARDEARDAERRAQRELEDLVSRDVAIAGQGGGA